MKRDALAAKKAGQALTEEDLRVLKLIDVPLWARKGDPLPKSPHIHLSEFDTSSESDHEQEVRLKRTTLHCMIRLKL